MFHSFRRLARFATASAAFLIGTAALASAGTVSISTPGSGSTVTSPIRVVASASSSYTVTAMKIYLDGNSVYSVSSKSLDKSISASTGQHRVTVKAWDKTGSFSKTIYVTVSSTTSGDGSSGGVSIPSSATTWSRIEEMSGWDSCTGCAGGGENATYSMTQHISSPSIDGDSAKFFVGGTTPFSHGLWWRRMTSNTSATNFVFDMYYYMPTPSASHGLEFAANQMRSDGWYKFSTQCTFGQKLWRVWDSKNGGWVSTGITCSRPPANTWQHVVFEYKRANGKAVFVSITVNGQKHYANKSFYPQAKSGDGSIGIHFQLNGNSTQTDYTTYADKMKLSVW